MTSTDLQLEKHFKSIANRPQRKKETTITTFDRNIFWYDKDELSRQADQAAENPGERVTYEDHRKAVELAVTFMHNDTQHDIAMCILSHRMFKTYRAKVFAGEGSFNLDYGFLITRIGTLFNASTSRINNINLLAQLQQFKTPTLIQINHITGDVTEVKPCGSDHTLNEWAMKYNQNAAESTSYRVAGLAV